MSERSEDGELTAIESALRELRPKADAMDRAVLMYRAGRASARGWGWPAATLLSTAASMVLGIALWVRPAPPVVYVAVQPVQNDALSAASPVSLPADESERGAWSRYVHLQEQVSLHGLDGLPSPSKSTEGPPPDTESLLKSF